MVELSISIVGCKIQDPISVPPQRFGIEGGTIGREPSNTMVLHDPNRFISRIHARIDYRGNAFRLQVLGLNGVVLNGRHLALRQEVEICDNDELVIGEYRLLARVQMGEWTSPHEDRQPSLRSDSVASRMRILVVDRDPRFRRLMAVALRGLGPATEVIFAESVAAGLKIAVQSPEVNLALLELVQPGASAIKAISTFRTQFPSLPVIVLSDRDDSATVEAALKAGAMGFIPKSSPSSSLLSAIHLAIGSPAYIPPTLLRERSERTQIAGSRGTGSDVSERPTRSERSLPLAFSVFHPESVQVHSWAKLLAYIHIKDVQEQIDRDASSRIGDQSIHRRRLGRSSSKVPVGAEIHVVPQLPGCRFNPPSYRLHLLEEWHCAEFRVQAIPSTETSPGPAINGVVSFYLDTILLGDVPIWAVKADESEERSLQARLKAASAAPYGSIFVSYAREDVIVVEHLRKAYRALGMQVLQDIAVLRSGEEWKPELLRLIESADVFQLYWSEMAKASHNVEREWRHALALTRKNFVRPIYWKRPIPKPPEELAKLHFAFLEQPA